MVLALSASEGRDPSKLHWGDQILWAQGVAWVCGWIKERKNPPSEAIQFNGEPCHELGQLWGALHGTYNAANDRPIDTSVLELLEDLDVQEWPVFSSLEL